MPNRLKQKMGLVHSTINRALFDDNSKDLTFVGRFCVGVLRIFYAVLNDMTRGQLSLRAMSLVYTTLIALVPLIALSFSVLKGFGVHNQIEPFLLGLLEPLGPQGITIVEKIIDFVDNIKVGVLGVVGLGLLVYSVIALMQKIERAFNFIWRVDRSRSLAQRFSDYLSALLIGSFFIFISAGLTTYLQGFNFFEDLGFTAIAAVFAQVFGVIVPYLIMALAFTMIFIFMPNTKVSFFPALIGGLFSAFAWKGMGFLFAKIVAGSGSYVAIYAAFAAIIVFMIWVYLAWLVVLIGASIAFYMQHPRYILIGYETLQLSNRMKEKIALMIVYHIGQDFYAVQKGKKAKNWDAIGLSKAINMPITAVNQVLDMLIAGGVIAKTLDAKATYVPGMPFDKTSIKTVLDAVRAYGEKSLVSDVRIKTVRQVADVLKKQDMAVKKSFGAMKVKDLF